MKVICAWCNKDMGTKPPLDSNHISHGICDECKERELKEYKEGKKDEKKVCFRERTLERVFLVFMGWRRKGMPHLWRSARNHGIH